MIVMAITVSYYHNNNERINCTPKQMTNNLELMKLVN